MPPKVVLTIRTANRAPQKNYLGATVENLLRQGASPKALAIFATDPDVSWMPKLPPGIRVHVPHEHLNPNRNGLAQVLALDWCDADWIVMTEDDLEWCLDPIGSIARWLDDHARPDVSVYRFFAFDRVERCTEQVGKTPLREQKGSQAIAMRAADARRFRDWALAHPKDWRPKSAPFQYQTDTGFDKLVGYWALQDNPEQQFGMVSLPFFVKHIGVQSSLHAFGKRIDHTFAGESWFYQGVPCPA